MTASDYRLLRAFARGALAAVLILSALSAAGADKVELLFKGPTDNVNGTHSEVSVTLDIPTFNGEEMFDLTSERLAAFATGWRNWQGTPDLLDRDLLCYLPRTLGNPFRYVFFDRGARDSQFRISERLIYRDEVLWGVSMTSQTAKDQLKLKELVGVHYLYLADTPDWVFAPTIAKALPNLEYLCVQSDGDSNLRIFLENCPIRYFHICRPLPGLVSSRLYGGEDGTLKVVGKCPGDGCLSVKPIESLRYFYMEGALDAQRLSVFPNLEGLLIGYLADDPGTWYLLAGTMGNLRIFVCDDDSFEKATMPTTILASEKLEHLHTRGLFIPGGAFAVRSPRLRSVSLFASSGYTVSRIASRKLQYLCVSELEDWGHLTLFPDLRVFFAKELPADSPPKGLNLRHMGVEKLHCTAGHLRDLLDLAPGGLFEVGIITGVGGPERKPTRAVGAARFTVYSLRPVDAESDATVDGLLEATSDCVSVFVFSPKSLSERAVGKLAATASVQVLLAEGVFISRKQGRRLSIGKGSAETLSVILEFIWDVCIWGGLPTVVPGTAWIPEQLVGAGDVITKASVDDGWEPRSDLRSWK